MKIKELVPALEAAQKEVNAEPDPVKRKSLIDKYQPRWTALRPFMSELSFGKCWYTESKNPGFDADIDHYRPKNSVDVDDGEPGHGGYYWLAFVWRNYRFSCSRGNRLRKNPETKETGGKGDRFPLLDPMKRLTTPTTRQEDLDREHALLLDPARPGDESVITFSARGLVEISAAHENNPVDVRRFEETRRCYNLDWPDFRDERVVLYNLIEEKVMRGDEAAPPRDAPDVARSVEFDLIVLDLHRLMDRDKCYSAAARAYLFSFRSYWWVEEHVLRIVPARTTQG